MMKRFVACLVLFILLTVSLYSEEAEEEKGFVLPMILNFLPGFGLGSFIQGDTTGGVIVLIGDLVGLGCVGIVLIGAMGNVFAEVFTLGWADTSFEGFEVFLVAGLVIYGISKIFGIIRPIWFAADYNANLKRSQVAFEIVPGIRPSSTEKKFNLSLDFRMTFCLD